MTQNGAILLVLVVGGLLAAKWLERRGKKNPPQAKRSKDPLDNPLLWWSETDAFTVRDLLNGGVSIIGRAGSGKTSSSGREIGQAILNLGMKESKK